MDLAQTHQQTLSISQLQVDIYRGLENDEITVAVYFDHPKAFNLIDDGLLNAHRIRKAVLKLISSYLQSRKKLCLVNKHSSPLIELHGTGAQQRSTVGSLLFILSVNSFKTCY